ncbi:hypothetical protein, partial [Nocardia farcinica]|uniref:hypothetical protein n=1 Tax=Nocardia farcinica TaxID=37329 RepID=UPI002455C9B4
MDVPPGVGSANHRARHTPGYPVVADLVAGCVHVRGARRSPVPGGGGGGAARRGGGGEGGEEARGGQGGGGGGEDQHPPPRGG